MLMDRNTLNERIASRPLSRHAIARERYQEERNARLAAEVDERRRQEMERAAHNASGLFAAAASTVGAAVDAVRRLRFRHG